MFNAESRMTLLRLSSLFATSVACIYVSAPSFGQDGTNDASFDPGTGVQTFSLSVYASALAIAPDGGILIGGNFTAFNGVPVPRLVRVQNDGSLDSEFDIGTGPSGTSGVVGLAVQDDGKVIVTGGFLEFNGVERPGIVRLNSDGSVDEEFVPAIAGNPAIVSAVAVLPDGKILAGGSFTTTEGTPQALVRLNPDGSHDTEFVAPTMSAFRTITLQPDGRILVISDGMVRRLNANGSLNNIFGPFTGSILYGPWVTCVAVAPDGKILVGGDFTHYGAAEKKGIVRLNANGTVDNSFDPGLGPNEAIEDVLVQQDGKVIVSGWFTYFNQTSRGRIARLTSSGSVETSFGPPWSGLNQSIVAMAEQTDGKIIIAGWFPSYFGASRSCVARVNNSIPTGIAEMSNTTIVCFPNPTADIAYVDLPTIAIPDEVLLYDGVGRIVRQGGFVGDMRLTLDLSNEMPGLYHVLVRWSNGRQFMAKVVKE